MHMRKGHDQPMSRAAAPDMSSGAVSISQILSLALQTADPFVARQRAAILWTRFEVIKSSVSGMIEQGTVLTGPQIEALIRQEP